MTENRAPLPRTGDDMDLPPGKTCADCTHCNRCTAMFGHIPEDESCDWSPSRFTPKQVQTVKAPDSREPWSWLEILNRGFDSSAVFPAPVERVEHHHNRMIERLLRQARRVRNYSSTDDVFEAIPVSVLIGEATTPQPAAPACTGKNCGSTDPNLHSADCFAEHEQAITPTAAQDVAGLVARIQDAAQVWYENTDDGLNKLLEAIEEAAHQRGGGN